MHTLLSITIGRKILLMLVSQLENRSPGHENREQYPSLLVCLVFSLRKHTGA